MRGKVLAIEWQEEAVILKRLYQQERRPEIRTRLQGLWQLRQGKKMVEVAALVGVHYRTVQEWVKWYRTGGVTEVVKHRRGGRGQARRMKADQERALMERARTEGFDSVVQAQQWAKQELGVAYSYSGMRWVFERFQLKKKVPRPMSEKASAEAQQQWKKGV